MYIAVELNEDGTVNDFGYIRDTPEAAWEVSADIFHAPSTILYKLVPVFKVKEKKTRLIPIKE